MPAIQPGTAARMYKIRGIDQQEYGPISHEGLLQWISERRVLAETPVQMVESGEWRPLRDWPEFREALAQRPRPTPLAPSQRVISPAAPTKPSIALAVISMIFGILGTLCFGIFTGIPAVITGHIARRWARRQPERYGGARMALVGLICGYLSFVTTGVFLAVVIPALAKMQQQSGGGSWGCQFHLRQVTTGLKIYASDHGNRLPESLENLTMEIPTPLMLHCSRDPRPPANRWADLTRSNITYELLLPGALLSDLEPQTPIVRCPFHGSAGLVNGTVQRRDQRSGPPTNTVPENAPRE